MIRPLRKRHFQAWSLMALLLPAGLAAALLLRPRPATGYLLQPAGTTALPVIIAELRKDGFTVRLRGNASSQPAQLEWLNTSVLRYPTAVIYMTTPGKTNITEATLIGRIETRDTYRFTLPADSAVSYQFIVYDFIKQQQVDSFHFLHPQPSQLRKP